MLRERNYKGGSCVHASWVVSLRMQGLEDWADWWRANYAYGEYPKRLAARADRAGLKYAYTLRGDADFLDWCSRTNRPATIGYFWRHSINFICFEGGQAKLLDNNRTHKYLWVPRGEFLRRWRGYGGWAVVPIAEPVPPTPWIART